MSTVAVDANPATRPVQTGTELYARELVHRLPRIAPEIQWTFYSSRPARLDGVDLTVLPMARLWSQARLPIDLRRLRPDLFFAPSHVVPFLAPGRTLTVVHDLAFEHFPSAYRPAERAYLRLTTRWAERRCPLLIAVSEATRRDLATLHGVDPGRVRVVHPGVRPPETPADPSRLVQLGLRPPFALHVGRIEPRKNQLGALAALRRVDGLTLACAGPVVDEAIAQRLRESGRAVVLGRVGAADLELLYRSAAMLVFPSLHEGFGFPILEAMARELPVVTVRTSSLPEIAGDAALYAEDPEDYDGLAAAAARLLEDPDERARLSAAGRARAAGFTWERTAAGVVAVIRDLIAPSTSRH